ncbi:MAG: sigma-54 dependent transcriptional regulator [Planctomycetota bacterium]|nr:sigma-54 dependent transcriptional regulator [Planctomycetota bacterium]
MDKKLRVLVVDDESFVRESLAEVLSADGMQVATAKSVREAKTLLAKRAFDAIVSDVRMPGESGVNLVDEAGARIPPTPIVLLTGVGTVKEAVAAMKKGAFDFVQKPIDPDALIVLVRRAAEHKALLSEVIVLRDAADASGSPKIVGESAALERVRALVSQVAPTDAIVFVYGESGSGKNLVARAVHAASSRSRGPLKRVSCATASEESFDHELFGVRKSRGGALDAAEGGTLVLDHVDRASANTQAKLLALLETGEFRRSGESEARTLDVRFIALSSTDLAARAKAGSFRADLYFRLSSFPIALPPLRSRKEDIALLATDWLARRSGEHGASGLTLSPHALDVLASYDWPGNVRELENVLDRASIVAGKSTLTPELLRTILESGGQALAGTNLFEFNIRSNLDAREKELVLGALERTKGKKRDASDLLGIDARNLGYYLRKHKIQDKPSGDALDG